MTEVIARDKVKGKHYEILVDVDKALSFKKNGQGNIQEILGIDRIFHDSKKGIQVTEEDMQDAFGTTDILIAAGKIIKNGEIQVPQEYREKEQSDKRKQVIEFLSKHAFDPRTEKLHTPDIISKALGEAKINVDNRPVEQQLGKIILKLRETLPIKIQSKRLKIRIPSEHTGKAYGLLQDFKEKENWLSNGDLEVLINLPLGLQDNFYDKINAVTHGSVMSEEIKEKE